ncbi:ArsR/SmtB family transcription factor [Candidatus Hodarchaeum mangrovi]
MIINSELYSVLAHPHRRTLIREIYYEGEGSIKHFRENLNFKIGTLYHHLKVLINSGLIQQTEAKKYILTTNGMKLIMEIFTEDILPPIISSNDQSKHSFKTLKLPMRVTRLERLINNIFEIIYNNPIKLLFLNLFSLCILLFFLMELQIGLVGCFIFKSNNNFSSAVSLIMSSIGVISIISIIPRIFRKSEPTSFEIVINGSSLFLPISLFLSLIYFGRMTRLLSSDTILLVVGQILLQLIWIIWIYMVFRKIYVVEKKSALISSFVINYSLLTLAFVLI